MRKKIYYILEALILLGSAALSFLRYRLPLARLWYAFRYDFLTSARYYFVFMFTGEKREATVTSLPNVDLSSFVSIDAEEILRKIREMWAYLFNGENFTNYCRAVLDGLYNFCMFLMMALPIVWLLIKVVESRLLSEKQINKGKQTRGVRVFRKVFENPFRAIYGEICTFVRFLWNQPYLFRLPFLLMWFAYLNLITVVVEFFAFYLYFAMAFDFLNLPIQITKLFIDVLVMLDGAPFAFWLVVALLIADRVRRYFGYRALDRRERANRRFLEAQPLVLMLTGTMGSKKTTTLTDMAISEEIIMREKALELLLECDALYPNFSWINLEKALEQAFRCRTVYTLTACRDWVALMRRRFVRDPCAGTLFDYDIDKYVLERDDGLWISDIWETIEEYACLYMIYIVESSLIVSNYSVRSDNVRKDLGNLPRWSCELFRTTAKDALKNSQRSHVLNYDTLRLGKKMLEQASPGSFEFGVIAIAEVGKERGNTVTQQELKKNSDSCNQKNDLFNWFLKICRHPSTVRNHPFIRILTDDQRPESWGADARDLASILHIRESSGRICLMPGFFICDLIYDFLYPRYENFFTDFRYYRSDVPLLMYLLHNCMTAFHRYHAKIYNVFGCYELAIESERGTMDGDLQKDTYYILTKKDYSDRFATDSHRGYTDKIGRASHQGLNDWLTYAGKTASIEELHAQRSHFVNEMEKLSGIDQIEDD